MSIAGGRLITALRSRRGLGIFASHFSAAFATLAGCFQLIVAAHPSSPLKGIWPIVAMVAASLIWAGARSIPRTLVSREFTHPNFTVTVKSGDLFSEDSDLVIGFTDTYDTSTEGGDIVSPESVQAQFLRKVYGGNLLELDDALSEALRGVAISRVETQEDKPRGKRERYPVDTVAVLSKETARYYCVAYSHMSNDLIARSSVNDLWRSLSNTWSAISRHGHLNAVAIPILGSDLARVSNLGRESLLKMILLSFVAKSREGLISRKLTLVIHHRDARQVDMNEVRAFMNSL
ncbi:macro domain-containing protein [Streptomyces sp. NPDC097610]|uniref:macro domain-containing protein n=1 Tax=Streptomyces sp. NPDC097610 TaxID=3157227 RepID=UPI0033297D87